MDYRDQMETGECPRTSVDCSFTVLKKPVILEAYQELRYSKIYDQGDTRVEHDPENLDFLEGVEESELYRRRIERR